MEENEKIIFRESEVNILSCCVDDTCEEMSETGDPRLAVLLPVRDKLHTLKDTMQNTSGKVIDITVLKELGYIDYTIPLPDKIPFNILEQLNKLEYYNEQGDSVCYYDRWDDLIVLAKNAIAAGVLTKKNWETIEKRYWYKAELDNIYTN